MKNVVLRILWAVLGTLMIIAGIICLAVPGITEVTVAIAYGVILLVSGIAYIFVNSFDLRRFGVRGWGWIMELGIVMTIVGFAAFLGPVLSALAMTVITGVMFIMSGISDIVHAILSNRFLK